ncbi:MAG: hypothetical protein EOP00_02695, partial [Pedobacter sp.]
MTIDEIYKKEEISVRSYHVCKYNDFNSISDLTKYYDKTKTFEKLRNCGRKSNEELIDLCNKYQRKQIEKPEVGIININDPKNILLNLTRVQREVINSFIFVNTQSLTVRSKNAISLHLKNNLKFKNFTEKILLSENFDVKNIKNIGAKCIPELEIYISIIKDFILEVSQTKDEKYLIALKNKFFIHRTFSIPLIPVEILESDSIFSFTNFLLDQNAFFDKVQTLIVKKALKIYHNQDEITLDDISNMVDLSKERVRQIRKICLEEFIDKLVFVQNFNDDLFQKYGIDIASNYLEIDTDVIEKINSSNKTHFSKEFITYILSAYLDNQFSLIGNFEDVLQPSYFNSRYRHNWNNLYLIKQGIALEFDFIGFANDIRERINDRIVESYSFNFKSYLSKFLTNNNIDVLDLIFPICEKITSDEFQLYLDLDENLNFKRNTNRQAHEYVYEALEQLGKPSKVKEIFEKVIELHPNYETEEAKIRVAMKRKDGFVPIGRNSVFGLKKWENELENFKGGTIREIVEEFLIQFSEPKHISEITEHVLKYRPKSNQYSILQNLKLDESGSYVFFIGSNIGITSKKYESDLKKISEVNKTDKKTWEERFEMLQNFIAIEKRLPFSNGVPENEIKLYRWLNIQKSKQNKGKLDKYKEVKINCLIEGSPSINGRRRLFSSEKYEELFSFVSINRRLPSANKNCEENLYKFFYKQRKLYDANELDSKEEIKFIEVAK